MDNPGGCGSILIFNFINSIDKFTEEQYKLFEILCDEFKKDGIGSITCTLGQTYYDRIPLLNKLGFNEIAEYNNYRHRKNGGYTQKMFIKIL